ncbi:hypothetical protein QFC20_003702 [Naganishia adeliensis]|uniref:Uncharacterized protein n=1 Tax=Naganishia adeliensis TaxID=92952 RepID=A0ACC2W9I9_9TREE|nr:hypothetical protein QFC20_003702 [Naganishia adeliensis]
MTFGTDVMSASSPLPPFVLDTYATQAQSPVGLPALPLSGYLGEGSVRRQGSAIRPIPLLGSADSQSSPPIFGLALPPIRPNFRVHLSSPVSDPQQWDLRFPGPPSFQEAQGNATFEGRGGVLGGSDEEDEDGTPPGTASPALQGRNTLISKDPHADVIPPLRRGNLRLLNSPPPPLNQPLLPPDSPLQTVVVLRADVQRADGDPPNDSEEDTVPDLPLRFQLKSSKARPRSRTRSGTTFDLGILSDTLEDADLPGLPPEPHTSVDASADSSYLDASSSLDEGISHDDVPMPTPIQEDGFLPFTPRTKVRQDFIHAIHPSTELPTEGGGANEWGSRKYNVQTTYKDVDDNTMEAARDLLRSKGLRLSSFLNSLPMTGSRVLKDGLGAWAGSKDAKALSTKWTGRHEWAESLIVKQVDAEVSRALRRKIFHLAKKDMTNARIANVDFEDLVQRVTTELPTTHRLLRAMIGPENEPRSGDSGDPLAKKRDLSTATFAGNTSRTLVENSSERAPTFSKEPSV